MFTITEALEEALLFRGAAPSWLDSDDWSWEPTGDCLAVGGSGGGSLGTYRWRCVDGSSVEPRAPHWLWYDARSGTGGFASKAREAFRSVGALS